MTNQALPLKSRQLLDYHADKCRNLGLVLDKFAPWGEKERGGWDLVMKTTIRRQRENTIKTVSGGEAKGIWLNTKRKALPKESQSLFEADRTDIELMLAVQRRWIELVKAAKGRAFKIHTAERLVAGLGASHVLETAITLDRNTGLPYLPGSSVKGLARSWGLLEVASQLDIGLDDRVVVRDTEIPLLIALAEVLISEPEASLYKAIRCLIPVLHDEHEAVPYIQWFRLIFGSQSSAAAVCFIDALYAGEDAPKYETDVMTPHYVAYYTDQGAKPPTESDEPNPVSFLTVAPKNYFAFGLVPRLNNENSEQALNTASEWLIHALCEMGAGSKTAAGYGFFSAKSVDWMNL